MRDLKILGLSAAGFLMMLAASAWAAGGTDPNAVPTPCVTPAGAIYSVNCSGASSSQTQTSGSSVLGDTATVPAANGTTAVTPTPTQTPSPSLTPGTMPSPVPTVTPASDGGSDGGGGSNLPDTGAVAVSSAIGLSAIGYAGWMYYKRRKLANEPVLPRRAPSDPRSARHC